MIVTPYTIYRFLLDFFIQNIIDSQGHSFPLPCEHIFRSLYRIFITAYLYITSINFIVYLANNRISISIVIFYTITLYQITSIWRALQEELLLYPSIENTILLNNNIDPKTNTIQIV